VYVNGIFYSLETWCYRALHKASPKALEDAATDESVVGQRGKVAYLSCSPQGVLTCRQHDGGAQTVCCARPTGVFRTVTGAVASTPRDAPRIRARVAGCACIRSFAE
jgi:hypothetical protein